MTDLNRVRADLIGYLWGFKHTDLTKYTAEQLKVFDQYSEAVQEWEMKHADPADADFDFDQWADDTRGILDEYARRICALEAGRKD